MKEKLSRVIIGLFVVVMLASTLGLGLARDGAVQVQAAPATIVYNIYATDGWVTMADGTPLYIYGFVGGRAGQPLTYLNAAGVPVTIATGAPAPTGGPVAVAEAPLLGNAQLPGPCIYASVGDTVVINFKNLGVANKQAPNDPHTIHLHGLDTDAANDGVPETSVASVPANSGLPGAGNVIVYMFTATQAGTYMYHCHQEADIHVQMGMYGALVIYEPGDAAAAGGPGTGGGTLFGWSYDKDYILLLTEIDVRQHKAEQLAGKGGGYNPVDYHPQYWLINGISFPNTIHAASAATAFNWTNWIAAHPGYDPLIQGSVSANGGTGSKILVRMINLGFETQPMHCHGFHPKVIGSDQRAWTWANQAGVTPWGAGLEKNTVTIGSGETYELLFNFGQQAATSTYQTGTQTRYNLVGNLPQSNTLTQFPAIPDPFTPGATYIAGPTVAGAVGSAGITTQLFPFHNHDDYKATNNGVYPGGMFTMIMMLN